MNSQKFGLEPEPDWMVSATRGLGTAANPRPTPPPIDRSSPAESPILLNTQLTVSPSFYLLPVLGFPPPGRQPTATVLTVWCLITRNVLIPR